MKKISNLDIQVGKQLKNARISAGLTQEQVAEKLDCSNRYIGQLETNRSSGSIEVISELWNLYGVSLNDIYGDYLKFDFNELTKNIPNIIGYYQLNDEYKSIVDNNIQFLNKLQNKSK